LTPDGIDTIAAPLLSRFFQIRQVSMLFDRKLVPYVQSPAFLEIAHAVERILQANEIAPDDLAKHYFRFSERYSRDLGEFSKSQKYPMECPPSAAPDKISYAIFLLLSPLMTAHRFLLFDQLLKYRTKYNIIAVIGSGIGLEVELLVNHANRIVACDPEPPAINAPALSNTRVQYTKTAFSQNPGSYDAIFAIEVLEHLTDPWPLILECVRSLKPGGNLIFSTAVNVPQFDHLYKFSAEEVPVFCNKHSFVIHSHTDIPHIYRFSNVQALNQFFVISKD
jgi:SAM-dependent methyltransferase